MTSPAYRSEQTHQAPDVRLVVDTIPTLAWAARADGSADFFNQRWLDYTGLSAEQARDWRWTVVLHPDHLNGLVDYWRSVLASGNPGKIEGRLRRFDGVYRWFLFRATPSFDNDGKVVKWFGTNTDIDDRKRAECLLAGENHVLEMTAKSSSLESILEALCRVVEETASGSLCSVLLIDPSGSKIEQAIAPSLPSTYNERFPGAPVELERGPCAEAALRICFASFIGSANVLEFEHHREVCSVSGEVMLSQKKATQPLSARLQGSIRFFSVPLSASPSIRLTATP